MSDPQSWGGVQTAEGPTRRRLGNLLVDAGLITPGQLQEALNSRITINGRPERIGEAIVRLGFCGPDEIGRALAHQLGLEFTDNAVLPVDEQIANAIPPNLAERHQVVPMFTEDDTVVVACADPTNVIGLDDVRMAIGARRIRAVVAPTYSIEAAIREVYGFDSRAADLLESMEVTQVEEPVEVDDLAAVEDAPIIRLANEVIAGAVAARASDVHVEPKGADAVVRHRIDGVLHDVMSLPRSVASPLLSRLKLMGGLDIAEKRKPQDGRAAFGKGPEAVDLRLSSLPTLFGESLVIRILRRDATKLTMEDLGYSESQAAQMIHAVERPQGLVLVTGPTGSGKTSTLYTLLAHLATSERKLITVEDPIEYELPGVVQTQVNERAGYTFHRAMRAMLRQDPDVIMVGEIRDPETAELALEASLTGHLVLSTLHTNDAPSAIVRLVELGAPRYLIASALTMVLAQRLARRVCPECAQPTPPSARQLQRLHVPGELSGKFVTGAGCRACNHTGYRGRTGVFELLPIDGAIRELITEGGSGGALQQAARAAGMRGLREDAITKAAEGAITLDEVLRTTPQPSYQADVCPVCAKAVEPDFAICPWCATDLRPFSCATCQRALDPSWTVCPSCGTSCRGPTANGHAAPVRPQVLVVDDEPNVRAALRAMLIDDYDVVEASTGREALEAVHANRPAAVVLDKRLPDLDGYDVTRAIRARPAVQDTPVLILTGQVDPDVQLEGLQAGADDWIPKPVENDVLLSRLGRLVRAPAA